jgi:hypothetical protein
LYERVEGQALLNLSTTNIERRFFLSICHQAGQVLEYHIKGAIYALKGAAFVFPNELYM